MDTRARSLWYSADEELGLTWGLTTTRLPDAAITDLFHIASEALEREDHLLASAMQEAYRAHGLYADRPHGIGSLRERPWAYVIYRALHKQNYAVKYGVELRWEPRYTPSRADEMDIGIFHPSQQPLPVACIELDWWDSSSATAKVVSKMRTNFPDRTVRKLIVLLWRRPEESTDPQSWVKPDLKELGLNSETPWLHSFGAMTQPPNKSQQGRIWIALAEVVDPAATVLLNSA